MDPATSFMRKTHSNEVIGVLESTVERILKCRYWEAYDGRLPSESFTLFLTSKKNRSHWNNWFESLENAYMANGDFDRVFGMIKNGIDIDLYNSIYWEALTAALETKRDFDGAVDALRTYTMLALEGILNVWEENGDYIRSIRLLEGMRFPPDRQRHH
jgi:hypothetical protein